MRMCFAAAAMLVALSGAASAAGIDLASKGLTSAATPFASDSEAFSTEDFLTGNVDLLGASGLLDTFTITGASPFGETDFSLEINLFFTGNVTGSSTHASFMTNSIELLFDVDSGAGNLPTPGTTNILATISGDFGDDPFGDTGALRSQFFSPLQIDLTEVRPAPGEPNPVPLPAGVALMLTALGALAGLRRYAS